MGAAVVLLATACALPAAQAKSPEQTALVRALEAGSWRFSKVQHAPPPVEALNQDALEVHDWRERAYSGGALRVYPNCGGDMRVNAHCDGDNVIALLADTVDPQ